VLQAFSTPSVLIDAYVRHTFKHEVPNDAYMRHSIEYVGCGLM